MCETHALFPCACSPPPLPSPALPWCRFAQPHARQQALGPRSFNLSQLTSPTTKPRTNNTQKNHASCHMWLCPYAQRPPRMQSAACPHRTHQYNTGLPATPSKPCHNPRSNSLHSCTAAARSRPCQQPCCTMLAAQHAFPQRSEHLFQKLLQQDLGIRPHLSLGQQARTRSSTLQHSTQQQPRSSRQQTADAPQFSAVEIQCCSSNIAILVLCLTCAGPL